GGGGSAAGGGGVAGGGGGRGGGRTRGGGGRGTGVGWGPGASGGDAWATAGSARGADPAAVTAPAVDDRTAGAVVAPGAAGAFRAVRVRTFARAHTGHPGRTA